MNANKEVVNLIIWWQVFILGLFLKHWHLNTQHQFYKHTFLYSDKWLSNFQLIHLTW